MNARRCHCERPIVFRADGRCLKCGHDAQAEDLRESTRRLVERVAVMLVDRKEPRGARRRA